MKIMIRATNWVGDAIMALPAIRCVRKRFSAAEIAIVARPDIAHLYRDQDLCDRLISYDFGGAHSGMRGRERLASQLRAERFDVAFLLQNAFDAAWLAWRAKIPERIGYARDGRGFLLTKPISVPAPGEIPAHEKFYYLELVRRAGWVDSLDEVPLIRLHVPAQKRKIAEEFLSCSGARKDAKKIAIGAGASYGSAKCWPAERFSALANQLQSETKADLILFGGPAEQAVATTIAKAMRYTPVDLIGKTALSDLPALLSCCDLFIGNDSGAMHIAAAVGLPVVAIFGPTDAAGTAPVTPRRTIVQEQTYCSPCFLRRCPTDHRCMTAITPSRVESAAKLLLATGGGALG
jgi:heptosyltransferase II